jgi:3-oxoacyl-[acyl-carrier-protein] synthase III
VSTVHLDHVVYALGDREQTLEQAAASSAIRSSPDVLRAGGFARHHICAVETTAYDLAYRAVDRIREHLGEIGALVYATTLPLNGSMSDEPQFRASGDVKHLMNFPASRLQADFGLDDCLVIGLNQQACTGMLGAIRLARMALSAEPALEAALCVTADRFPAGAHYEQAYNLISDGAAACIVSRSPGYWRVLACHGLTNGALAQADDDQTVGMFFSYAHRVIRETLSRAGLIVADIAWVVAQNTNTQAWRVLGRLLGFPAERIVEASKADVGHVIAGDNMINLSHLMREERVQPGDRALLFMAGFGLNWQCVILERTAA